MSIYKNTAVETCTLFAMMGWPRWQCICQQASRVRTHFSLGSDLPRALLCLLVTFLVLYIMSSAQTRPPSKLQTSSTLWRVINLSKRQNKLCLRQSNLSWRSARQRQQHHHTTKLSSSQPHERTLKHEAARVLMVQQRVHREGVVGG